LEVRALTCTRGDKTLFKDLSFDLEPGRPCQIVGPNGAGKTTLLRAICGLTLPTAGKILWAGQELDPSCRDYIATMTYIGHSAGIKLDLTARENLLFDKKLSASPVDMELDALLDRLDLDTCSDLPCRQLSAGQRRRVALGRLLTRRASIWLLDEPFTSIDQQGVDLLTRMMDEHLEGGGTLAVATHQTIEFRVSEVQRLRLGR
jgi:heme exporter protein A